MNLFLNAIIIALLVILIYQDFRARSVSWIIFPVLIICQGILSFNVTGKQELIFNTSINLALLTLQFLLLTLYFSFRNKRLTNIINQYIGIGDLFFFVFLSLSFSPFNLIAFFILSLLLTLIAYGITMAGKLKQYKIPLLGSMAIAYLIVVLLENITCLNRFDDFLMLYLI